MNPPAQSNSFKVQDLQQLIKHYLHLFWSWKWYILISGPIAVLISAIIIFKVLVVEPTLTAKALIGIENTTEMTAVRDVGNVVQAQSDLIQSRNFLEDIAKRLSLRFRVEKYPRSSIFDTVSVDSLTPIGRYSYKIDKEDNRHFSLFFQRDKRGGIPIVRKFTRKPLCIFKGDVADVPVISLGGMRLVFSPLFLRIPHEFNFEVIELRGAVEDIYKQVAVKEADPMRRVFNIAVLVSGRDSPLITEIANAIADAFVEKNVNYRRGKNQSIQQTLEKQLQTVKRDFAGSEDMLRNFRTANPTVGLSEGVRQRIGEITQMETGVYDVKKGLSDAQDLMGRFSAATPDDKLRVAGEVLVFLGTKGNSSAPVLQAELNRLSAEQREMQRSYAVDHPMRNENEKKIDDLEKDVQAALKGYITTSQAGLSNKTSNIQSLSGELQRLPTQELQLAELQRHQQIASDIYSTVLSRYNQAKVANAAELAEAYVMDYAVPPLPPLADPIKLLAIVFLIGIVIAFSPAMAFDYFDATVRTDFDFKRKTGRSFFEMIPRIPVVTKQVLKNMKAEKPPAEGAVPLVTIYLKNTYSHEVLRVLRTKVLMRLANKEQKVLGITSLESGTGKSTIAANLACIIAEQDIPTVLVDADLRLGSLYKTFGCVMNPGLSKMLMPPDGSDPVDSFIQKTAIPQLSFISCGDPSYNSSELLASEKFKSLYERLLQKFSIIIFDTPPIGAIIDAAVMAPLVSQYLVVVKAEKTKVNDLLKKIAEFPSIEERLMGYVLNFSSEKRAISYYKQSKYGA
jgi:tyrosine-protein kinase Etk/Wzc